MIDLFNEKDLQIETYDDGLKCRIVRDKSITALDVNCLALALKMDKDECEALLKRCRMETGTTTYPLVW